MHNDDCRMIIALLDCRLCLGQITTQRVTCESVSVIVALHEADERQRSRPRLNGFPLLISS